MPIPGNTSSEGKKPSTPVIGTTSAGNARVTVNFTPSTYIGKGTITYYATATPGGVQGSNTTTPIIVTGLTNGQTYSFVVNGVTNYGVTSDNSGAVNGTPVAPPPPPPPVTPPPPPVTPPPPPVTPPPPPVTPPPPPVTPPPPPVTPPPPPPAACCNYDVNQPNCYCEPLYCYCTGTTCNCSFI